jgi:guanylate kinase
MTTRKIFKKSETPGADYKVIPEEQFNVWSSLNKFMFVEFVEENYAIHEEEKINHARNPIFNFSSSKTLDDSTRHFYEWKRSGVLKEDVSRIMEQGRIAMVECSLQEALKIHSGYHNLNHECNFIYVTPPTTEEMRNRIIR